MSPLTSDDLGAISLSLKVASVATLLDLPLAILLALALARGRFPGRSVVDALAHLPLVIPPVATGYALLVLLGPQGPVGAALASAGVVLAFRWSGAAIAAAVMALPLMLRPIRLAIEAIDPEIEESARTLGAGPLTRWRTITLPLAGRGVLAAAVLGFARALGEFGATITFVAAIPGETLTLPSAIWQSAQDPGAETRTLALCAVSAAIAFAAILASEALARRPARP